MESISIIIPTFHFASTTHKTIKACLSQTILPSELVIIDSSEDNSISDLIQHIETDIPIIYRRVSQMFPGEARNLGANISNSPFLAFLDSKTIPVKDWLETNLNEMKKSNADVIFGNTQYLAETPFQKNLLACSFGSKPVESTPGSLISRENFFKSGSFQEGVRTGDDMAWRDTIKNSSMTFGLPPEATLSYNELPKDFFPTLKRFFIYQLHGSRVNIQNTPKNIMLSFFLIFLTILVPKWNAIVGWESSILYVPNITKIYILSLFVSFLLVILLNRDWISRYANSIVGYSTIIVAFLVLFTSVFYWNGVIAGWVESSVWYVPNITKIFLSLSLACSIFYRGVYFPLNNGISLSVLLPFGWIKAGMLGLMLDLVKAPGFILGALLKLFSPKRFKKE
jgi:glycosyltransferase involved in cell wall biosynthesis